MSNSQINTNEKTQGVEEAAAATILGLGNEIPQQKPPVQQQQQQQEEGHASADTAKATGDNNASSSSWDVARLEARRRSNRESAKRCRLRQKTTIQELEAANAELRDLLEAVLVENRQLRRMLEEEQQLASEQNRILQRIVGTTGQELYPSHQPPPPPAQGLMRERDVAMMPNMNMTQTRPLNSLFQGEGRMSQQQLGYSEFVRGDARGTTRPTNLPAYATEPTLPGRLSLPLAQGHQVPRYSSERQAIATAARRDTSIPSEIDVRLMEGQLDERRLKKKARR